MTDPFSTDLCPLSLDPEVLPILPAAVLSLRDKDEQGISTSFGEQALMTTIAQHLATPICMLQATSCPAHSLTFSEIDSTHAH